MTKKDKQVLIEGLKKLSADVADLAALLEGTEAPAKTQDAPAKDPAPMPEEEAPAKVYTYEETRAILAEKSSVCSMQTSGSAHRLLASATCSITKAA